MSQPPSPYERSYSFTDNSTANPTSQQPGQKIDQELNAARTAINATISRLGEVQADDGKVRNSALNLTTIAEAVEPLLTTTPIQAVNAAGASQVAAVNTAGTTQVANVNAAAAAGAALIAAETTTPNAVTILSAQQTAVIAAQNATAANANVQTNKDLTYNAYADTLEALNAAQIASGEAEGYAINAADSQAAAATEANLAVNAQNAAQGYAVDALASKMAALEAKGDAEAAANTAQSIVDAGAAAITAEIQPYLDAAEDSATSASASAFAALASQNAAAGSATAAASSSTSASSSATAASGSASSASASATAAANSAAAINPAAYAPAVHTHTVSDVTGLQTALDGKTAVGHTHTIANVTGLQTALDGKAALAANTFTGKQTMPAAVAGAAGFRLTPGSASPTSSLQGDLWFDSGLFKARIALSNGGNHSLATESWVTSQSYVGVGYLTSNGYIKFGDTGTHAFTYAAKKDYSATPVQIIAGGYSNTYGYEATATLSNAAYEGWTLNFIGSSGSSVYYNASGTTYDIYYDSDADVNYTIGQLQSLNVPGFSFSYSDDSMGPYYSGLTNWTPAYPTIAVTNSDRFIFDLSARMQEMAFAGSVNPNNTLFFNGTNVVWGRPWTNEGYVTNAMLLQYGALSSANSWGNKQTFPASTTTRASITIPHGTAPSSPTNGDVWSTTTGLLFRINGATRTAATLEASNTFSAAAKQTVSHSTASAGLRISPVASTVTSPASGDVWHDTSTGVNQIFGFANGIRGAMTACRAFVNFNGTGTVAIRAGFNVSSITDNGVGDYTVNMGVAMPDVNYSAIVSAKDGGGTWAALANFAQTASAVRVISRGTSAGVDTDTISVAILR